GRLAHVPVLLREHELGDQLERVVVGRVEALDEGATLPGVVRLDEGLLERLGGLAVLGRGGEGVPKATGARDGGDGGDSNSHRLSLLSPGGWRPARCARGLRGGGVYQTGPGGWPPSAPVTGATGEVGRRFSGGPAGRP